MKYLPIRIALIISIFFSLGIFGWIYFSSQKSPTINTASGVLPSPRSQIIKTATKSAQIIVSPSPKLTPSPKPSPEKSSYTIAAFGDSMVDTMGENLDYLDKAMMGRYPTTKFKFYNYGIGSQNVIEADKRFNLPFIYQTRNYPAIDQIKADIIIVSSFAYNPLSPYDKKTYSSGLTNLIKKSQATKAKVYLLAEIAPIKEGFGKGIGGVNWGEEETKTQVKNILEQLQEAIRLSKTLNVPLIDVFTKSQIDGKYGDKTYVGTHDRIHPSIEGEIFMADIIADTLKLP